MVRRILNLAKSRSFFLFGARGTGKSSLIKEQFADSTKLLIDLLQPDQFSILNRDPSELSRRIEAAKSHEGVIRFKIATASAPTSLLVRLVDGVPIY